MAIPRASAGPATFGRTVFRRASGQTRAQAWRRIGRRHYADTGHANPEHAKKSSELPWIIGSVGFTVPAAVWLFGQGPQTGGKPHSPEQAHEIDEAEGKSEKEPAEEASEALPGGPAPSKASAQDPEHEKASTKERLAKQGKSSDDDDGKAESKDDNEGDDKDDDKDESKDESKDDSKDESKDESQDDKKDESKDDSKDSDSDESKKESSDDDSDKSSKEGDDKDSGPNAPGQINYKGTGKRPGEGQKGSSPPPELKKEKDEKGDRSGAKNPYLDDDEKSKKGEGVKDTARIHGTVDSRREPR